jgi:Raf kinase inhibitor-like YbhB/YbcL family protein
MLQKLPEAVGQALQSRRAGIEHVLINSVELQHGHTRLQLSSPAFADGRPMPVRFTADRMAADHGAAGSLPADGSGISPPLRWKGVPRGATSVALIVEDADSPTAEPLVHAIAVEIDPRLEEIPEGALTESNRGTPAALGRNSYLRQAWLPPDPPPGHGLHRYVFQLFALLPGHEFSNAPGRKELATAIRQRAIGSGALVGTYERE